MVFRISGKAPHSKDKLTRLLSGVLSFFLNIFNVFVEIFAGPVVLLELSDFINSSIFSGSVADKKRLFARLDYLGRLGIWYLFVWSYPLFSGNSKILGFNEANITKSFNFKAKITTQIGANGRKDIEMIAPLKHQNNFWRTLEMLVINCEINLILTLFGNCVIAFITNANQVQHFQ